MGARLRVVVGALLACAALVLVPTALGRTNPPAGDVRPGEQLTFTAPLDAPKWQVAVDAREKCAELKQGPPQYKVSFAVFGAFGDGRTRELPAGSFSAMVTVPANARPGGATLVDMYVTGHCGSLGIYSATAQWGPYRIGAPSKADRLEKCLNLGIVPRSLDEVLDWAILCDWEIVANAEAPVADRWISGAFLVLAALPATKLAKGVPPPARRQFVKEFMEFAKRLGEQGLRKTGRETVERVTEIQSRRGTFDLTEKMTRAEADKLGKAWVGPNAKPISDHFKNGMRVVGLISEDRARVYRFPTQKKTGTQAGQLVSNYEEFAVANGQRTKIRNAHGVITN